MLKIIHLNIIFIFNYISGSFQLNMVITSIIIQCAIAMVFYKLIQSVEHYYKKKY